MNAQQNDYFKMAVPAAQESQRVTGVPASITIAQSILESGWGKSDLAIEAKNYFGIKATAAASPSDYIAMPTREVVNGQSTEEMAKFARYASPAESFRNHGWLLANASRYAPAMAARTDPSRFAMELQHCGYSTNPDYAFSLMELMREFDLTQYDIQPDSPATAQVAA